jgi:hypothetical protein
VQQINDPMGRRRIFIGLLVNVKFPLFLISTWLQPGGTGG